jgi:tetratricopeptide (TPR) repeat protein
MEDDIDKQKAMILFERAFRHHARGEHGSAIALYKRSLAIYATAEAHTFLGWTYSMLGRYDDAIACCKEAIDVDPTFGNSYNDIGAYLIELDRWEEAITWLEKATKATRYENPQFPHMNLGRVYQHLGRFQTALACFDRAVAAKYLLLGQMN